MHAVVNLWQECRSALVRRTAVIPRSRHSGFKPLINGLPYCLFNAVTLI
jgi:hypothetical protein